jgi:hypothetical protein
MTALALAPIVFDKALQKPFVRMKVGGRPVVLNSRLA